LKLDGEPIRLKLKGGNGMAVFEDDLSLLVELAPGKRLS
jgi:hypothetical protein